MLAWMDRWRLEIASNIVPTGNIVFSSLLTCVLHRLFNYSESATEVILS
jgi:hypothetical protein